MSSLHVCSSMDGNNVRSYDVIPRASFQPIFDRAYRAVGRRQQPVGLAPQELAVVYIVFALGALLSLELRPQDPSAEHFYNIAKACLAKGDFLVQPTLAAVQALVSCDLIRL